MKQKLYIRKENGRYEEYKPIMKADDGNLFFRKVKGKYIPFGRIANGDILHEGIWVVLSNLSYCSRHMASGDYLRDLFQIQKVSGIEDVSIAKLGGLEKYYDYVFHEWNKYYKDYRLGHEWSPSNSDVIHFIIGKIFEFNEKQKKQED